MKFVLTALMLLLSSQVMAEIEFIGGSTNEVVVKQDIVINMGVWKSGPKVSKARYASITDGSSCELEKIKATGNNDRDSLIIKKGSKLEIKDIRGERLEVRGFTLRHVPFSHPVNSSQVSQNTTDAMDFVFFCRFPAEMSHRGSSPYTRSMIVEAMKGYLEFK